MQITAVKPFIVDPGTGKNWLFVKVETDSGLYGWGEAYTQADRDRAIEIHIQQLGRYLIGRNPFDIKHFTFLAYNDYANKRGSMECYCAISGLEIALWDIVGKATGQPVYNLLGGKCRDTVRVYAKGWGGGGTPEEAAAHRKKRRQRPKRWSTRVSPRSSLTPSPTPGAPISTASKKTKRLPKWPPCAKRSGRRWIF